MRGRNRGSVESRESLTSGADHAIKTEGRIVRRAGAMPWNVRLPRLDQLELDTRRAAHPPDRRATRHGWAKMTPILQVQSRSDQPRRSWRNGPRRERKKFARRRPAKETSVEAGKSSTVNVAGRSGGSGHRFPLAARPWGSDAVTPAPGALLRVRPVMTRDIEASQTRTEANRLKRQREKRVEYSARTRWKPTR
jgi:hypothetical protein